MAEPRAFVRNAADPQQVRAGSRRERRLEERRRSAYRSVMKTAEGRFVLWDLILSAGVFSRMWTQTAEIHARAGRHDFGLEILQTLQVTEPELYRTMETEWWAREQQDARETDALHTPRAGETE